MASVGKIFWTSFISILFVASKNVWMPQIEKFGRKNFWKIFRQHECFISNIFDNRMRCYWAQFRYFGVEKPCSETVSVYFVKVSFNLQLFYPDFHCYQQAISHRQKGETFQLFMHELVKSSENFLLRLSFPTVLDSFEDYTSSTLIIYVVRRYLFFLTCRISSFFASPVFLVTHSPYIENKRKNLKLFYNFCILGK